jgi:hypothetical protein
MPLARLLRASPTRSTGPDAQREGDPGFGRGFPCAGEGQGTGPVQGVDILLAAAFDACFRGELDTDWDRLAAPSHGCAS